ncbi:MAG: alkaline phosphatase family protein [Chloroflexi bacterium]|nr:alkaline phosphatase family protein [Chloroflexota bacterium]
MSGVGRMSDAPELLAAFEAGTLLRPDPALPNLVDVSRAVAAAGGVTNVDLSPFASELAASFADREHLVLILTDGLGLEMLDRESAARTLRDNVRSELRTVFPSSTAVALTSLATGEWPATHAVTGWWTHIHEIGGPATILQFRRRSDDRSLADLGVTPEAAFPVPSLMARLRRPSHVLMPRNVAGSVYSRYWTGGEAATGYPSMAGTYGAIMQAVMGADESTFIYVYVPHIDNEAHHSGPESIGARAGIVAIDRLVADLHAGLGRSTTLVVTADHGHLAVSPDDRFMIRDATGIPALLASPPSGDARVLEFHVRSGEHAHFEERFRTSFGDRFFLLTTDEVEELRLLGPGPLSPDTRQRLGDFMAISRGDAVLGFYPSQASRQGVRQRSHHAGLTPTEMLVPLVVA